MGWVGLGPNFSLVVGWVGSVSWWVGLDRVTQSGPMDNSVASPGNRHCASSIGTLLTCVVASSFASIVGADSLIDREWGVNGDVDFAQSTVARRDELGRLSHIGMMCKLHIDWRRQTRVSAINTGTSIQGFSYGILQLHKIPSFSLLPFHSFPFSFLLSPFPFFFLSPTFLPSLSLFHLFPLLPSPKSIDVKKRFHVILFWSRFLRF